MDTCQLLLSWSEPVCSPSGYSSVSAVSAPFWHTRGTGGVGIAVADHLIAKYAGLRGTVAHLGLRHGSIREDRPASGPVVVKLGGQRFAAPPPLLARLL